IRILPEMCASTLCPLSSSTRNCVLGSASVTVPSTSMTSSLAKDLLSSSYKMAETKRISYHAGVDAPTDERRSLPAGSPVLRQHQRAVLGDGDGVLEVGRKGAVGRVARPPVPLAEADIVVAERDHGLYGEGHTGEQARSRTRRAVIRYLGVLVHLSADPVGDEVPYYPVTTRLGQVLYRVANVAEPVARAHLVRRRGETLSCGREQPDDILGHVPDRDGGRRVGYEALIADADVEGDYVAVLEAVRARDAVHDHGVWRGADRSRKSLIPLELGLASAVVDELLSETVELPSRHAWPDVLLQHLQASRGYPSTLTHRLELRLALADDQASSFLPTAPSMSCVTFGISCSASTVMRRSRSA